jgi:hypothetical protein
MIQNPKSYAIEKDVIDRPVGITSERIENSSNYTKESVVYEVDAKTVALTTAVTNYINKNKSRDRYHRIHDVDTRCLKRRLMMLLPDGTYVWSDDPKYWRISKKLYAALYPEMENDAERQSLGYMAVNYQKRLRYLPEAGSSKEFKIDPKLYDVASMHAYRDVFDDVCVTALMKATAADIALTNKKDTSMGFPYERPNGLPINSADLVHFVGDVDAIKSRSVARPKARLIKDWSPWKREWREDLKNGCLGIFEAQQKFIRSKQEITPDNICTLMELNLISVHNVAMRENCADVPLNITADWDPFKDKLYSKDRRYSKFFWKDGKLYQEDGLINSQVYNRILDEDVNKFGICNRNRKIYPSNNMMHTIGTVLANGSCFIYEHHNPKAHPSVRPEVQSDWNDFAVAAKSGLLGRAVHVFAYGGDCTNAEVTISSNNDIFYELVPERFLDYLKLTNTSIIPYDNFYRAIEGAYCSAVWFTTWRHLGKGNYEAARLIHALLVDNGVPVYDLTRCVIAYAACLFFGGAEYEDKRMHWINLARIPYDKKRGCIAFGPDVWINPKLGTDDITGQIACWKILRVSDKFKKLCKDTCMSFTLFLVDSIFGMLLTPMTMNEDHAAMFRKMFFKEHMGFVLADAFMSYIKCVASGHADAISSVLRSECGVGVEGYANYIPFYYGWLEARGHTVADVFSEYSPQQRILMTKVAAETAGFKGLKLLGVDEDDPTISWVEAPSDMEKYSTRVKDEVVELYLDSIRSFFRIGA